MGELAKARLPWERCGLEPVHQIPQEKCDWVNPTCLSAQHSCAVCNMKNSTWRTWVEPLPACDGALWKSELSAGQVKSEMLLATQGAALTAQLVKNSSAMQETLIQFPCQEDLLEKG